MENKHSYSYDDLINVVSLLDKSISKLVKKDKHLIQTNAGELTINHRLAIYLENNLPSKYKTFNVDCEYFRDITNANTTNINRKENNNKKPVPDIIIHKRGYNFPTNYIYLEAKREKSTKEDISKIQSFIKDKYCYKFGVYIRYFENTDFILYDIYYDVDKFEKKIEGRVRK